MLIAEILNWNNDPAEPKRPDTELDLPPPRFNDDPTNLANAFTRSGLVKSFWNLNGSEGQPPGPAPPDTGTEMIQSGTLEPTAASWEAEPVETDPGGSASALTVSDGVLSLAVRQVVVHFPFFDANPNLLSASLNLRVISLLLDSQ